MLGALDARAGLLGHGVHSLGERLTVHPASIALRSHGRKLAFTYQSVNVPAAGITTPTQDIHHPCAPLNAKSCEPEGPQDLTGDSARQAPIS